MKKNYMKPALRVVKIQHQGLICISNTSTTGLGGDNLIYNDGGGDPGGAW